MTVNNLLSLIIYQYFVISKLHGVAEGGTTIEASIIDGSTNTRRDQTSLDVSYNAARVYSWIRLPDLATFSTDVVPTTVVARRNARPIRFARFWKRSQANERVVSRRKHKSVFVTGRGIL